MEWPEPGAFLGREAEAERLRAAIGKRVGLAVCGPADAGKTALVRHVIARLPKAVAKGCIYTPLRGAPHEALARLLEEMHARGDALLKQKFRSETGRGAEFSSWVEQQTSLRMRGLLYRAAEAGSYCLILDDVAGLSDAYARIVKELSWMRGTPVYLVARGWTEQELGRAARLYWNDELRLEVGPLELRATRELLEHCIRRYGLARLNLDGFREGIVRLSGRLPGAVVKMCARAGDAQYHFGDRIETRLLHVDYMMQFSYRVAQRATGTAAAGARGGGARTQNARK